MISYAHFPYFEYIQISNTPLLPLQTYTFWFYPLIQFFLVAEKSAWRIYWVWDIKGNRSALDIYCTVPCLCSHQSSFCANWILFAMNFNRYKTTPNDLSKQLFLDFSLLCKMKNISILLVCCAKIKLYFSHSIHYKF
jgi:hypothetical protein